VPAPSLDKPAIDYTDKDFASLRQAMLGLATYRLPEWTDRSPSDIGMLLIDLFAYVGDVIAYYQDRIASESFLDTAVERRSVLNLLRLIGYELAPPLASAAELNLTFNPLGPGQPTVVTIPFGAEFATKAGPTGPAQSFVYIGADRDLDLAGPDVAPTAENKLVYVGLPVRQGRVIAGEIVGSSTGEPNQAFQLASSPAIIETLAVEVDEGAGPVEWERRRNLLYHVGVAGIELSGANARDYYVQFDEENRTRVVFGDGEYGRRPAVGRDNVRASYVAGGGSAGNVPAGAITEAKTPIPNLATVTNPSPGAGGSDEEPIERAVRFGPLAFRSGERAVTLTDFVSLALNAGGVAKVHARTTGWNRVDLYVAPEGETCTSAPDDLKQRLVSYFETRRMVGTSVHIKDPVCVPVDVSVEIVTAHNYPPEAVRQQAEQAVASLLAFRNVEFGMQLYLSKVYEAVEAIDGVHAATVTRFRRQDQSLPRTLRRNVLLDAGLGDVSALVERAFQGEIPVEGRIEIGEVEIPKPGTIAVALRHEAL
jgi:uncharacterized phage protein gp47/JayE